MSEGLSRVEEARILACKTTEAIESAAEPGGISPPAALMAAELAVRFCLEKAAPQYEVGELTLAFRALRGRVLAVQDVEFKTVLRGWREKWNYAGANASADSRRLQLWNNVLLWRIVRPELKKPISEEELLELARDHN